MLSERDRRVLADMERHLVQDDPALAEALGVAPSRPRRLSDIRLLVVGLFVLVASAFSWAGSVVFVVGLGLTLYAVVRLMLGRDGSASARLSRLHGQEPSH